MKPSLPQGTRDFGPEVVRKRQYILQTIQTVFELFGFQPLETPAFENLDTLMGKYGEEGDKLIFKILNNGLELPEKHEQTRAGFEQVLQGRSVKSITERALKYDLTIPFARYVAMHHAQLPMPFRRYQMQTVWRADRPQRGRYREFTQCDVDVVGSRSLLNELDLIQIYQQVFSRLQLPVQICLNHRKILTALAMACGDASWLIPVTVAIDKLDKIGREKVFEELRHKGFPEQAFHTLESYLDLADENTPNEDILQGLKQLFVGNETGWEGIADLETLLTYQPGVTLSVSLARGLNYYTGSIFEVKPVGVQMGSLGGGGRYDDLTGLFGVKDIPGVGISFGVDRIYDVLEELQRFPSALSQQLRILMLHFGDAYQLRNQEVLSFLRSRQIACTQYPDAVKVDKQFKYANKLQVPFVGMIGEEEMAENCVSIKNLQSSEQRKLALQDIPEWIG